MDLMSYNIAPCAEAQGASSAPEAPSTITPQLAAYLAHKSSKPFAARLRDLPENGTGKLHNAIYKTALAGLAEGLSAEVVQNQLIEAAVERGRPPQIATREVADAVSNAHRWFFDTDPDLTVESHPRPVRSSAAAYDSEKLRKIAEKQKGFGEHDLKEISPINPEEVTAADFLHALYQPGEKVLVFDEFTSQGEYCWTGSPEGKPYDEDALESFKNPMPGKGAWFLLNPVHGDYEEVSRLITDRNPKGRSRRAEECITAFRYLLIESDAAPMELWISALVQLPLPIVSITKSGGKSIHALVRIDAKSADDWKEIKARIAPGLITIGADKGAMSSVRLTRLPGSYRADKKAWQELLYLNPHADGKPICVI